jgi:hypothetical protein
MLAAGAKPEGDVTSATSPGRLPACRSAAAVARSASSPHRASRVQPLLAKLVIVLAAFAAGVGLAELFGAKNLGTSLGVGQLTFAVALTYVIIWRR